MTLLVYLLTVAVPRGKMCDLPPFAKMPAPSNAIPVILWLDVPLGQMTRKR
jgi:hypothetical protein